MHGPAMYLIASRPAARGAEPRGRADRGGAECAGERRALEANKGTLTLRITP